MALQKKNPLLGAHLIVVSFWFVVLFLASEGFDLKLLAGRLSLAMMVLFLGALCGIVLWIASDISRKSGILSRSGAHSLRGAHSTLGELPLPTEPERGTVQERFLIERFPWWNFYRGKHPEHAQAFRAVLGVMLSEPKLPASPVPGGHGGATLIEHSCNVVDTMLQMAPKWSYRGHKNKKGEIVFPLLDTTKIEHRFDLNDPILTLAAFAHDIGKVACYRLNEDGSVSEVRKNHDIEGAKIMRALPEVMDLSWKDRVALLTACEFYHHAGSIPQSTWIDDRSRSLVELLVTADIATGRREGGAVASEGEDETGALTVPSVPEHQADDDNGVNTIKQSDGPETVEISTLTTTSHGTALDLTYSALLEPGRVNGTNSMTRIAWKHGEWLYINDAKLRGAIAIRTGDSEYNSLPHRGNMHAFTLELMSQLAAGKNLLQEHNGHKFSEKRSIYTTRSSSPGKTSVENKFVIVARTSAFPGLENAADCKTQPVIVGCSWGDTAAINKNAVESHAMDVSENEERNGGNEDDEVDLLMNAAASMSLPFTEKKMDGTTYLFFEEEILKEEYPDKLFQDDRLIRKAGAASGKTFIGVVKGV